MQREELEQKWQATMQNLNIEGLQLIDKLMGGISEMEEYNINTTEERKAEIAAERKQRETERKEREAKEKAKRVFRYARNDTMKLLGHQYISLILPKDSVVYEQFNDIGKACPHESTFDAALDYFTLGHIWGIRTERAKRKGSPLF